MAKNDKTISEVETETALALPGAAQEITNDVFSAFLGDGFASIDTVLIGAKDEGKLSLYMGELIGPGEPIEMDPDPKTGEIRSMTTWSFHPLTRTSDGKPGVVQNVTHVIPASYQVQAGCARIHKLAQARGVRAWVAIAFLGKTRTRKGYNLNVIRVFEKYLDATGKQVAV